STTRPVTNTSIPPLVPAVSMHRHRSYRSFSYFMNAPPPTAINSLSLHDALPIFSEGGSRAPRGRDTEDRARSSGRQRVRSEGLEIGRAHAELQSPDHLVCRLLLEKKTVNNKIF